MKRCRSFNDSKVFSGRKGSFNEPKVFGGNFKYMKGFLRNTLEGEKENKGAVEEVSMSNEVLVDCTVVSRLFYTVFYQHHIYEQHQLAYANIRLIGNITPSKYNPKQI